jgi:hypothetical protein
MQCNTSRSLAEFCSGLMYTPLQRLVSHNQVCRCASKTSISDSGTRIRFNMIPKLTVGPGSVSDSSVLYYQYAYFFLGHFYCIFYFISCHLKVLSLDNFRLIVVICLITPSVLQEEDRLASQDGLWNSIDIVIPHGKKKKQKFAHKLCTVWFLIKYQEYVLKCLEIHVGVKLPKLSNFQAKGIS